MVITYIFLCLCPHTPNAIHGAIAPVQAWLDTLREGDVLLVDDCHGLGVLGGGRGGGAVSECEY